MNKHSFGKRIVSAAMIAAMWTLPIAMIAQTRIIAPKNKYKVQDDIKLGSDASREIEKQFPIINDADATAYIERVGRRLVAAIPPQFNQPAFNYRFKWVNASDINAFALPGGPMYVNRGMIENAKNEGEMAGVMAHEISHVALRHATAQQTQMGSAKNTLGMLGMIIGGAILGGDAGAQLGMLGAAAWMTKYSRAYESQSDTLGAQIMANAGYDPRDLANVFRTIQQQEKGGGGPQWISSHPDPGNRYEAINKEAQYLNVSPNPIKITRDFERIQARFRAMPKAKTMAQIEKEAEKGQGQNNPTSGGRYTNSVQYPSSRVRSYTGSSWLRVNVPSNWREFASQDDVQFAPEGAYGDQGITRGAMFGVMTSQTNDLGRDSEALVNGLLQGNSYLRQQNRWSQVYVAGREGYSTQLTGRSPLTNQTEIVTIYTASLRNGGVFYVATVVPQSESNSYSYAFKNMLNSIRLND
ncbi:MAG TPA: M48 family metallopeptidase [Pyrinomonadaceae bacterium]|nr:M48 family metallopeptidase [Pyrinomonadaceae bacterium]